MKITNQTNLYRIWEDFASKWVYVKQKNGTIHKLYLVDVDDEFDPEGTGHEQNVIVYNDTGSDSYGNGMLLSEISEINLSD